MTARYDDAHELTRRGWRGCLPPPHIQPQVEDVISRLAARGVRSLAVARTQPAATLDEVGWMSICMVRVGKEGDGG